jgi:hypothetical protein
VAENSVTPAGLPPEVDPSVPHVSRVLDYLLGGTANFEIDRAVAAQAFAGWPGEVGGIDGVRVDIGGARDALSRIVTHIAAEGGVRQFLDICSGLPTENNTHEAAQRVAPESRTVYVDNDPVVVAHARHLLGDTGGKVAFLEGELSRTHDIIDRAAATLDFDQPVGIILFGALHFFEDEQGPDKIVKTLLEAVPSGSFLAFSHFAKDDDDGAMDETFEALNRQWGESVVRRTKTEAARFFDGLEIVEPGVVELPDWRPAPGSGGPRPLPMWCGLARKP